MRKLIISIAMALAFSLTNAQEFKMGKDLTIKVEGDKMTMVYQNNEPYIATIKILNPISETTGGAWILEDVEPTTQTVISQRYIVFKVKNKWFMNIESKDAWSGVYTSAVSEVTKL